MATRNSPLTYMNVPAAEEAGDANAVILGIPYECLGHRARTGSDQAPDAIRRQSALLRPYQIPHADFDPLQGLGVTDLGNVSVTPGDTAAAYGSITAALDPVVKAGAVPVTLGGDGSVTLPQLRAVASHHGPLALIHIDAHTDTGPGKAPGELSPSTTFTRAAEENLLDMDCAFHIGVRGTQRFEGTLPFSSNLGFGIITGDELFQRGIAATGTLLREHAGDRPTYLCFDMDVFDPSCAPGVCQPECGGLSAREGLTLLQSLAGTNIVAADINTVSPPQDVGDITAHLATRVALECLALIAWTGDA